MEESYQVVMWCFTLMSITGGYDPSAGPAPRSPRARAALQDSRLLPAKSLTGGCRGTAAFLPEASMSNGFPRLVLEGTQEVRPSRLCPEGPSGGRPWSAPRPVHPHPPGLPARSPPRVPSHPHRRRGTRFQRSSTWASTCAGPWARASLFAPRP